MGPFTKEQLAATFDHTNLKAFAGKEEILGLCKEALEHGFASVMVKPADVALCAKELSGSPCMVGTVCGFPLGACTIETKVFEANNAIQNGAAEIDYVLHIGRLKDGDLEYIRREMQALTDLCHQNGAAVKVIFEICCLTEAEISSAAKIAREVRPDFIKTSTGFGTGGATAEAVRLMKKTAGIGVKVKAAGGIRSWKTCKAMLEAGAARIGTSSGIEILSEFDGEATHHKLTS